MSATNSEPGLGLGIVFVGMDEELRNARLRRGVVAATLFAAEHADDVIQICHAVDGDELSLRTAVMETFGFDEVQADAIVSMQVRRFTPRAIEQLQAQLAEVDALISKLSDGR